MPGRQGFRWLVGETQSNARLAAGATRLLADVLRKRPEVTVVQVVTTPDATWFLSGESLPPSGQAAYAEVKITAGSNTDAEKAVFLAAFSALLNEVVGPMSAPVYTLIHETPAAAWGYDGLS